MPKTIFDCTVCDILKNCGENKEIIDNINNVIVDYKTEKDIEGLFDNVDLKDLIVPTFYYIKKHRDNCLKGFKVFNVPNKNNVVEQQDLSCSIPDDFFKNSSFEQHNIFQKMFLQLLYKETVTTLNTARINKDNVSNIKNLYELAFNHQIEIVDIKIGDNRQELTSNILEMIRKTLSGSMINRKELLDIMKYIKPEEYNLSNNDNNLQRFSLDFNNKENEENNIET
jgi:hypothetical protein